MRSMRDPKRKPTHPGELLRLDILPALEMTQADPKRYRHIEPVAA